MVNFLNYIIYILANTLIIPIMYIHRFKYNVCLFMLYHYLWEDTRRFIAESYAN